jgi:predicted TIM-barrel fold metal-dependent hydrolase
MLYRITQGNYTIQERKASVEKSIDELCSVIKENPDRFIGFGCVPLNLSKEETKKWIHNNIVANGLKGIGEFMPGSEKQMEALETIFEVIVDIPNCPIWVHTFNPVTIKGIQILMDLCIKFPSVPVIFGHCGGSNWMDIIKFAKVHSNVYVDLSATFTSLTPKFAMLEIPEKCLFSSDAPFGEPKLYRQMIEALSPSAEVTSMVLGDNIGRLLKL